MHQVVAHSNMIKWCVVWRHSRHLSHPSLGFVSPSCTKATRRKKALRFLSGVLKIESFILRVNSQADRYSVTVRSTIKQNQKENLRYLLSTHYHSCMSQSVANHHKHTHMRNSELADGSKIRGGMMYSQFWELEQVFRLHAKVVPQCYSAVFQERKLSYL